MGSLLERPWPWVVLNFTSPVDVQEVRLYWSDGGATGSSPYVLEVAMGQDDGGGWASFGGGTRPSASASWEYPGLPYESFAVVARGVEAFRLTVRHAGEQTASLLELQVWGSRSSADVARVV